MSKFNRADRRHHAARVRARKAGLALARGWVQVRGKPLLYTHNDNSHFSKRYLKRRHDAPDFPEETLEDLIRKCPHYQLRGVWFTACERLWDEIEAEIEWETWEKSLEPNAPVVDLDVEDDWQQPMTFGEIMVRGLRDRRSA